MADVFVSYRVKEASDEARQLHAALVAKGVSTFICGNIAYGMKWPQAFGKALDSCKVRIRQPGDAPMDVA
jgi:hypothetical protein